MHSVKVQGKPTTEGVKLLPHREFWASVYGLCADGLMFTRAEVAKRRGGGGESGPDYEKVPDAASTKKETETAEKNGEEVTEDEELVE